MKDTREASPLFRKLRDIVSCIDIERSKPGLSDPDEKALLARREMARFCPRLLWLHPQDALAYAKSYITKAALCRAQAIHQPTEESDDANEAQL